MTSNCVLASAHQVLWLETHRLYCSALCHAIHITCVILYYTVLQRCTSTVWYWTILSYTCITCTILCSTVLQRCACIVLYCTVLYAIHASPILYRMCYTALHMPQLYCAVCSVHAMSILYYTCYTVLYCTISTSPALHCMIHASPPLTIRIFIPAFS